jgi:hypothetical protein
MALPRTLGHFTLVIMQRFVIPFAVSFFVQISSLLQVVTDPFLDPMVDLILFLWKISVSFVVGGLKNVDTYVSHSGGSYEVTMIEAVKSTGWFIGQFLRYDSAHQSVIISKDASQNVSSLITEDRMYGIDSTSDSSTLVFLGTIFIGYMEMLIYKLYREVMRVLISS